MISSLAKWRRCNLAREYSSFERATLPGQLRLYLEDYPAAHDQGMLVRKLQIRLPKIVFPIAGRTRLGGGDRWAIGSIRNAGKACTGPREMFQSAAGECTRRRGCIDDGHAYLKEVRAISRDTEPK